MSQSIGDSIIESIAGLLLVLAGGGIIYGCHQTSNAEIERKQKAYAYHAKMLADTAEISSMEFTTQLLSEVSLPPSVKVVEDSRPGYCKLVGPPRDLADVIAQVLKKYL